MSFVTTRSMVVLSLLLCTVLPARAATTSAPVLQPNKLVILSTSDVKGKTAPCGCHVPKGGLSRRASYVDSVKASYGQVLLVDDGGFFPEEDNRREAAPFLMGAMKTLGTDAVNIGDRDLRFGRAYLEQYAQRAGLPVVSANLLDKQTKKPVFTPYMIKRVGGVTVGIFGLISDKGDLGPGKDSLTVEDPATTARNTVTELKHKGAQVIVLLSQLGKVEGEDLVAGVDGIDAIVMGRNGTLLQRGRMVKDAIACYGGDQGHYVCRTEISLDDKHRKTGGQAEAVMLGPEIPDNKDVAAMVKSFEDALSVKAKPTSAEAATPVTPAGN
jgi:2',3'-cyclic-nucleotide 2'-phosphodiesterase (5'-nucleotidase family)